MTQLELVTVHDPISYNGIIMLHSCVDQSPNNRKFLDQMQLLFIMSYLADKSKLVSKLLYILSLQFKKFMILSTNYFYWSSFSSQIYIFFLLHLKNIFNQ